ncbi:leucine carboxyl methyltransferase 1 [Hydra vulgaris]|nr:leucine carboxyl methyltransferase 1 [Hydra vulgaris]
MSYDGFISTNDDASHCKKYAVSKGYWFDPYIDLFVTSSPGRKTPEISRGYYIRHWCIKSLVEQFLLKTNCQCQIVNLGAGFDTLFWNILEKQLEPKHGFYEIDMPQVVKKKKSIILSKLQLNKSFLSEKVRTTDLTLDTDTYHLMACDLREVKSIDASLCAAGISKKVPTLILAECVFVYMDTSSISKLLNYFTEEFPIVLLADYDPINLNDKFGEVMRQNLSQRNCPLLGAFPDIQSKKQFYKVFSDVNIKLLSDVYNNLPSNDKQRIERLEFLDEVDLLYEMLRHYSISWSYNAPAGLLDTLKL